MSADPILQCYYDVLQHGLQGEFGTEVKSKGQIDFHTHQVAGHRVENGRPEFAMRHGRPGRLLKPFQDHDRGKTELTFYKTVFSDPKLSELRTFLPQFHALLKQNGVYYLELGDLTYEFKEPCIVDIKIGALLYGPEKMTTDSDRIEKKYPLARHIGYQILGMKTYCSASQRYIFHDKIYFRQALDLNNVIEAGLGLFFQCYVPVRRQIVAAILPKLESILAWFSQQKSFVFYGSSLLIMYEGGAYNACSSHGLQNGLEKTRKNISMPRVDARMIDFTHVFPSNMSDENYLLGLRTLISHFKSLMQE